MDNDEFSYSQLPRQTIILLLLIRKQKNLIVFGNWIWSLNFSYLLGNVLEKSFRPGIRWRNLYVNFYGNCLLYNKEEKTLNHLFNTCELILNIWPIIQTNCPTFINSSLCIIDWLELFGLEGFGTISLW